MGEGSMLMSYEKRQAIEKDKEKKQRIEKIAEALELREKKSTRIFATCVKIIIAITIIILFVYEDIRAFLFMMGTIFLASLVIGGLPGTEGRIRKKVEVYLQERYDPSASIIVKLSRLPGRSSLFKPYYIITGEDIEGITFPIHIENEEITDSYFLKCWQKTIEEELIEDIEKQNLIQDVEGIQVYLNMKAPYSEYREYKTKPPYHVFAQRAMQREKNEFSMIIDYDVYEEMPQEKYVELTYSILKFLYHKQYITSTLQVMISEENAEEKIEDLKPSDVERIVKNEDVEWIRSKLKESRKTF